MTKTRTPQIYNIPAGRPFAKSLAAQILLETKDDPALLAGHRIVLPSRRACRVLREAFLSETKGKPLLLPQMQSLGDVDEEELSLGALANNQEILNIPPALPTMKRRFLLTKLIESRADYKDKPDQALALAIALSQLLDHIYTENLDIKDLDKLVPDEFATHWQITLDFLKILSEHWPKILQEQGVIDEADRRNRLILALADHLETTQPQTPIIAAGSTGSIPATARLLGVIASLPQGRLVLPGLDNHIDDESWNALEDHHPQFGLKLLLNTINHDRKDVQLWPAGKSAPEVTKSRRILATEIMRPSTTTQEWGTLTQDKQRHSQIENALQDLNIVECEHEQEEASLIALLMRETLENPQKTAILITPSRPLAKRVRSAIKRWNIQLDDSAGKPLLETTTGQFLKITLETILSEFGPVAILSLLKHPFTKALFEDEKTKAKIIETIDLNLRGPKPQNGLEGIKTRLQDEPKALEIIEKLESIAPTSPHTKLSLKKHIANHIKFTESLASETLWTNEDGTAASGFFAELLSHADLITDITTTQYLNILETLMKTITVRPAYGTHPRLHILGQLESRMINADRVILAGLNEGTWPPDPGHDPWMSRPMRTQFGLPSPERSLGLAAHDFVQGFCAPEIFLTRSKRTEGSPTIPARWLQRLSAILDAAQISDSSTSQNPALHWVKIMNKNQNQTTRIEPVQRPEPRPPISARPTALPVTQIETWLKDPYSVYSRYILGLKKLNTLEQLPDAALRGAVLHKILERFVSQHKKGCIKTNFDLYHSALHDEAKTAIEETETDPALWEFWWPRFGRIATWFLNHETAWRTDYAPLALEAKGKAEINGFTLTGIADRIDQSTNPDENGQHTAAIIDYKSGGSFPANAIANGKNPQLPLEALILAQNGFEDVRLKTPQNLSYLILNGADEGGKLTTYDQNIEDLITDTKAALTRLITIFKDEQTPYHVTPNPDNTPRFNDYTHLARTAEWGVLGDTEDQEAA